MLQETSLMIFLFTIMMTTMPCSAFTPDRSGNVPVTENVSSTLGVERKVPLDHASSPKAEITSIDKDLQIMGTKSTSAVEQMSPTDVTLEGKLSFKLANIGSEGRSTKIEDANPMKEITAVDGSASTPRNIVMAISKLSQDRDDIQKIIKASHSFAAEGTLQSCNCSQVEGTRYSLDDPLNTGNKMRKQDCEHFLRSNIASLLTWARDVKGMTTELIGLSKDFDEIDEYNTKPTVQKLKPEIRGDWRTIDLGKPVNNEFLPLSDSQEEDDAAWKVFDMFSKVKWALFRSLLESLGGNIAATEESTPSRKLRALRSNLADVVEELKSAENENGFILVASVPPIELDPALELLQREATQDTLLVVTGVCSHDTKTVPFFAQGPSANMLREATTIWDVPDVIRNIIAGGCQDSNCRSRRHDIFPPSIPSMKRNRHNVVTLKRSARDIAKKSDDMQGGDVSAVKEEAKNVQDLNSKNEEAEDAKTKEEINRNKDVNSTAEINGEKDAMAKEERVGLKDVKAKAEINGDKDAMAKEEREGLKDMKAKEEIDGLKDVKSKEEREGLKDVKAKGEIDGLKDVKSKEEREGLKDVKAKAEINGDKDAMAKEEREGLKDIKAKGEIDGLKDVKSKEEREGLKDVKAKGERHGLKDVQAKQERDGGKRATAEAGRNAGKDLKGKAGKNGSGSFKVAEKFTSIISTVISMAVVFTLTL